MLEASMGWIALLVTWLLLLLQAATVVAAHNQWFGGLLLPFIRLGSAVTAVIYAARASRRAQSAIEREMRDAKS